MINFSVNAKKDNLISKNVTWLFLRTLKGAPPTPTLTHTQPLHCVRLQVKPLLGFSAGSHPPPKAPELLAADAFTVKGNAADDVVRLPCAAGKVARSRVTYGPWQSPPSATIKLDFQWLLTTSKVTLSDSIRNRVSCWHWGGPIERNKRGLAFVPIWSPSRQGMLMI